MTNLKNFYVKMDDNFKLVFTKNRERLKGAFDRQNEIKTRALYFEFSAVCRLLNCLCLKSLRLTLPVLSLILEIAGDRNGEGNMERTVLEGKSTSIPDGEVIIPSPIKNSTDTESVKTDKVSLKSG